MASSCSCFRLRVNFSPPRLRSLSDCSASKLLRRSSTRSSGFSERAARSRPHAAACFAAEQQLIDRKRAGEKLTRQKKKQQLDALAAAGFLQSFLDGRLPPIQLD